MVNLRALETYFNDSIILAKKNNPRAIPVIKELKTISLDHAAGYLSEGIAKQKMHNILIKHGHNPSLLDSCFFEAKNIKAASFEKKEFMPNFSSNNNKKSGPSSSWGNMFNNIGKNFNGRPTVQKRTPKVKAFIMPNFETPTRAAVKVRPQNTSYKMADFGKGFIIKPFNIGKEKRSKNNGFGFEIPVFKFGRGK